MSLRPTGLIKGNGKWRAEISILQLCVCGAGSNKKGFDVSIFNSASATGKHTKDFAGNSLATLSYVSLAAALFTTFGRNIIIIILSLHTMGIDV